MSPFGHLYIVRFAMKTIKRIAAIVILVSFFLPLTQCQNFMVPVSELPPEQLEVAKEATNSEYQINMAKSFEVRNLGSWLLLLAFLWPLLLTLLQEKTKNNVLKALVIIAPIFCAITIYYIGQILILGRPLYGGYIWFSAMGAFTVICVIEVIQLIRSKSNNALSQDAASGAG